VQIFPAFCLLLNHTEGGTWIPLVLITMVLGGALASLWLFVSGIKGLIAASMHSPTASPKPWIRKDVQGIQSSSTSIKQHKNLARPGILELAKWPSRSAKV
jgi:hypothetical protein